MYTTEEISGLTNSHVVRMSFELPYFDWCRFKKSELFRRLTEFLEESEKQKSPIRHSREGVRK